MENEGSTQISDSQKDVEKLNSETVPNSENDSSSSDSESDSDSDDSSSEEEEEGEGEGEVKKKKKDDPLLYIRPGDVPEDDDNSPEANIRRFNDIFQSRRMKRLQKENEKNYVFHEDLFNFPKDPENWKEEDLMEFWADAPLKMTKPGWDPVWADEDDWDVVREEVKAGRDPGIAPFYVPYRKPYPVIPDNHYDISSPKSVIEELDRIEEFLTWVSYIFPDGSSYEGTVWDDLAHGKGVLVAGEGLVRYEGEWVRNDMEGHGVVEVDIPDIQPVPGSKLEAKMRAEGKIITRDFMSPEDREWLEMDIEDSIRLADGEYEIPWYESEEWVRQFGDKPEKGRYRYAGQWKHGRMHGCGVYEVNEQPIYGRFYFGELLDDEHGCDENISAMHSSMAEIAAAKARMFVNKPDGMVREMYGPYNDPQHPYFYEEEDVWMAPGFINQFYEVPDYWKYYVHEVDEERQMWLNSFYKSPLRLPMPAELEYWWSQDHEPEFVVANQEPEPDPEDPSKLIFTEDPVIIHTKSGRIIDFVEDEEHGVRLFWQEPLNEGENADPTKLDFLPLGFDEFYGIEDELEEKTLLDRVRMSVGNVIKPFSEKIEKWAEEQKKNIDLKIKLLETDKELIEAEMDLEEAIKDLDAELKEQEKEEEKKAELGLQEEEEEEDIIVEDTKDENISAEVAENGKEEEEDDDDDDDAFSSFGSANGNKETVNNGQKGKSPFSSTSLSFASSGLVSLVPSRLQESFLSWKKQKSPPKPTTTLLSRNDDDDINSHLPVTSSSVSFSIALPRNGRLRAAMPSEEIHFSKRKTSQLHSSLSRVLCVRNNSQTNVKKEKSPVENWLRSVPESDLDNTLSLQIPFC